MRRGCCDAFWTAWRTRGSEEGNSAVDPEEWDEGEEEDWAARITQRGWRWTRKRVCIGVTWEEKLQEKLREPGDAVWRKYQWRASAKKMKEAFKELQAILKAEEKEGRKLLTKELASLGLDMRRLV